MDDILDYQTNLKEDLINAFENIDTPGTFAAWGALPATPPAGLHVDGVGDIAMPLTEEQVRQLIDKSHQAPFGRRSETLVDVSVRNTWEINGDQLRFLDPAWQSYLLDLSKRVAINLGIEGLIRLDLYKMLIYEKGAMFKPHTDTERTPGMFGTLIICLPSPHTGGEVVVKHNGECKTLRTSDAKQSFACWYSDVTHEVLPVTSGHRCVLTYNMAIKPGHTRPAASAIESQKEPLRKTLRYWLRDLEKNNSNDVPSYLYHALNHEYTEATMSLETLKAEDFARVQTLRDLADELPFEIFLTLLEKEESGTVEADWRSERSHKRGRYDYDDDDDDDGDGNSGHHDIDEICETNYKVKSLRALDGKTIASKYDFDMSFCTEEDPFQDLEIAREDYESYQGNCGPSATHWYRRSAIAIVPHDSLAKYLAKCASNRTYCSNTTNPALLYLGKVCSRPTARKPMLDAMSELCLQQGHLPLSFFDWVKEWLNKLPLAERTEKYQTWIPLLIHGYPYVAHRVSIIEKVSQSISDPIGTDEAPTGSGKVWAQDLTRQCITHLLESNAIPTSSDGSAIVAAVLSLNETSTNTSALLTSIFDRFPQVQATAFLLAFLAGLKKREAAAHFPTSENVELRKSFAPRVFNLERTPASIITRAKGKLASETGIVVSPQALAKFTCDLADLSSMDGTDLLRPFIEQINANCLKFSAEDMRNVWMPFLYQIIPPLASRSVALSGPSYQQLARQFIKRMDDLTLGACPRSGINHRSPQVRCGCGSCAQLNAFLQDTSQRVCRFKVAKAHRQHLHQQIDGAGIDCTHTTERVGSPQTLVVTKRYSLQEEITRWKKQQKELYASITNKIQPEHLESLLGPQEAVRVRSLAGVALVAAGSS
ncbi:hypothetical protein Pst134EB_027648 [Puccinia striiformis f. sp. tritici]|nr:hypothetical protein Pst134EB_027648 [Puccinia striiformis f. sp. tritici]